MTELPHRLHRTGEQRMVRVLINAPKRMKPNEPFAVRPPIGHPAESG